MGALEEVTRLKKEGKQENEIINELKNRGLNPKEIQDAISQVKIKDAINAPEENTQMPENTPQPTQDSSQIPQMQDPQNQSYSPQGYDQNYGQQDYDQGYSQDYSQGYDQGYNNPGYSQATTGTDNMIEIAEQVFSERIKNQEKKISEVNEFKSLTETKIQNMAQRLERIEKMLDTLQVKILEKVGLYGQDLNSIKKEMTMIEDSFQKAVNPMMDKAERKTHSAKKHTKKKTSKKR